MIHTGNNVKLFFRLSIFIAILFFPVKVPAASLPFDVGEKLEFGLSWMGIPAGTTILHVRDKKTIDGKEAFHIESTSWSNRFVSTFYKVDDRIECYMDAKDLTGIKMKIKQREGRHKNDKEILFNQTERRAEYIKNGSKSMHEVPNNIRDSLSSFYFLRTMDLEVGKDVIIDTFASGKLYKVTVEVLKKERLMLKLGTFNTIKVRPKLKHNDVFMNKGDVYIWLTDDEEKIPIQIKSEIVIGSIKAELTKLERGGKNEH